jgi:hypothetical protein
MRQNESKPLYTFVFENKIKDKNRNKMVHPDVLPSAIKLYDAGEPSKDRIKYPHLPKAQQPKAHRVIYPSLSKTGCKAPATKIPMGYTRPILTKMDHHVA